MVCYRWCAGAVALVHMLFVPMQLCPLTNETNGGNEQRMSLFGPLWLGKVTKLLDIDIEYIMSVDRIIINSSSAYWLHFKCL